MKTIIKNNGNSFILLVDELRKKGTSTWYVRKGLQNKSKEFISLRGHGAGGAGDVAIVGQSNEVNKKTYDSLKALNAVLRSR